MPRVTERGRPWGRRGGSVSINTVPHSYHFAGFGNLKELMHVLAGWLGLRVHDRGCPDRAAHPRRRLEVTRQRSSAARPPADQPASPSTRGGQQACWRYSSAAITHALSLRSSASISGSASPTWSSTCGPSGHLLSCATPC